MVIAFLIGRIIFGGFFIMGGFNHFTNLGSMSSYVKAKGVPAPKLAMGGSGVLLILGGLSLLLGFDPVIGIILLIIFLLGVTPAMHAFWKVEDPVARMGERVNFMKNLALLGALLMMLAIPAPWPLSL
ncbi:MAG TPA: DoxX family membrane protein [Terriglobia bacterium]|nr:DoxX family membrane protein [Terriglobia bacterium]